MKKKQDTAKICLEEREQLLSKYLEGLPIESAISLEEISSLVERLEDEYKQFLTTLWEQVRQDDEVRSLDDVLDKRYNRYILNREYAKDIRVSQSAAEEITLWEQITNTNIRDIEHLNVLICAYAKDLLAHITLDFMENVG